MRLSRWFFWLLLYLVGTFGWMVFLEHGPGWDRFQKGVRVEGQRIWTWMQRGFSGKAKL